MILPNNGKVIIIDDQPDDVKELIAALSKEKIPFVHFKEEDLSDLPETPMENIRLVFLDLELVTDVYVDAKNITAPIKTRLMRVLEPNTPYALVIWSKKENQYKEALLNDFNGEFQAYRPIFHTTLPKANIIGQPGAMATIKKELEIEIAKFKSFNVFLVWEAMVNEASGKLTNSLSNLYAKDAEWNDKTRFLLYKLAEAYSGKAVNDFPDVKQIKNALYTLTLSLNENIESAIDNKITDYFNGLISSNEKVIANFSSLINKLLLLSEGNDDITQPGNLFFQTEVINRDTTHIEHTWKEAQERISKIPSDKQEGALAGDKKKYHNSKQRIDEYKSRVEKQTNEIVVSSLLESVYTDDELKKKILATIKPIEINVTPLCDYAQEKTKLFRILPGALVESQFRIYLNGSPAYVYISDADFRIEGADYLFIFDFRFLYAVDGDNLQGKIVKYRIKHQLLSDIQVKLGAHVNRSGVVFVSNIVQNSSAPLDIPTEIPTATREETDPKKQ